MHNCWAAIIQVAAGDLLTIVISKQQRSVHLEWTLWSLSHYTPLRCLPSPSPTILRFHPKNHSAFLYSELATLKQEPSCLQRGFLPLHSHLEMIFIHRRQLNKWPLLLRNTFNILLEEKDWGRLIKNRSDGMEII